MIWNPDPLANHLTGDRNPILFFAASWGENNHIFLKGPLLKLWCSKACVTPLTSVSCTCTYCICFFFLLRSAKILLCLQGKPAEFFLSFFAVGRLWLNKSSSAGRQINRIYIACTMNLTGSHILWCYFHIVLLSWYSWLLYLFKCSLSAMSLCETLWCLLKIEFGFWFTARNAFLS